MSPERNRLTSISEASSLIKNRLTDLREFESILNEQPTLKCTHPGFTAEVQRARFTAEYTLAAVEGLDSLLAGLKELAKGFSKEG